MTNGDIDLITFTAPAAQTDGGRLSLVGMRLHPYPGVHMSPLILQNHGALVVRDSTFDLLDQSAGSGIVLTSDSPANDVAGNNLGGWALVKPPSLATIPARGTYGPNGAEAQTFEPTAAFAIPGGFAIASYERRTGQAWMLKAGYPFDLSVEFTMPDGLTRASGELYIPLPLASAARNRTPLRLGGTSGIRLDRWYTKVKSQFDAARGAVVLSESGSDLPARILTASNFMAGRKVVIGVAGALRPP